MRKTFLGFAVFLIAAVPVLSARAAKKDALFHAKLSSEQKIIHALNRLTFGPRAGDFEQVRRMGLKKWIDLELHPERIPENATLEAKLQPLDSLRMNTVELAQHYPPPQLIRAMAAGRAPYPSDPQERKMMERLAQRFERRLKQQPEQRPSLEDLAAKLLTPEQMQTFHHGSPDEKLQLFFSLPEDQQEDLLEAMPQGSRRDILAKAPVETRRRIARSLAPQELVVNDLNEGKLYRAIYSNRQLQEVLADFWYNHFNVYLDKGADRYLVTSYERDAIRPHVLGKFKDLLQATAERPAMLFYLDNWQSVDPKAAERRRGGQARRPPPPGPPRRVRNENYARELLELHTLGVDGGYTQKDIIEVARCFTGWTIRDPQAGGGFEFNERVHDKREKTVLGVKIPAGGGKEDGLKVLDILVHHPSTAHFISRKLAQRFVADNPPESLVEKMAASFKKSDGDIREVLKTMFSSNEFWSQGAYRAKMKSPLEMVASSVRALNADVDFAFSLGTQIAQLGQPLYRKQEPTGYSNSSDEWVSTNALLARMNFAQALTGNKLP